jgi:hypothetical protein
MRSGSFLPMEFVDTEPMNVKKITDEQRALLCLKSSLQPSDYRHSINEIRQNPKQQCFEKDPFIKAWKLNVDIHMLIIPARILPMPDIIYHDQYRVNGRQTPKKGIWDCGSTRFYQPTKFPSVWSLINLSSTLDRKGCEVFYEKLNNVAAPRGINCPPPAIYEEYCLQSNSIENLLITLENTMAKNDDCKFFIVILPEDDRIRDRIYGDLKKLVK